MHEYGDAEHGKLAFRLIGKILARELTPEKRLDAYVWMHEHYPEFGWDAAVEVEREAIL